jgi:hypothetical protein
MVNTLNATDITAAMIEAASVINDIDDAVHSVMQQVGIDDGTTAGMVLEDYRETWADASTGQRKAWLHKWADAEVALLTPEPISQTDYIEAPNRCPKCRSLNIQGGSVDIDANTASQAVSCSDCDAEWSDIYHLVGYQITN